MCDGQRYPKLERTNNINSEIFPETPRTVMRRCREARRVSGRAPGGGGGGTQTTSSNYKGTMYMQELPHTGWRRLSSRLVCFCYASVPPSKAITAGRGSR